MADPNKPNPNSLFGTSSTGLFNLNSNASDSSNPPGNQTDRKNESLDTGKTGQTPIIFGNSSKNSSIPFFQNTYLANPQPDASKG